MDRAHPLSGRIALLREEWIVDYHACLDSVARERVFLCMLRAPSLENSRAFARKLIGRGDPFVVWVDPTRRPTERVLGWCDITRSDYEGMNHRGVLGMGVAAAWRGLGIGRALIGECLRLATNLGIDKVELDVYADNLPAIRLYETVGFVREGLRRRARCIDGRWQDIVLMGRHAESDE